MALAMVQQNCRPDKPCTFAISDLTKMIIECGLTVGCWPAGVELESNMSVRNWDTIAKFWQLLDLAVIRTVYRWATATKIWLTWYG
jgi:hypothetical protein